MKKLGYKFYWLALAVIGIGLARTGVPLIILMLAAFSVSWLVETWHNHKFKRELVQMAREVKERGNVQ